MKQVMNLTHTTNPIRTVVLRMLTDSLIRTSLSVWSSEDRFQPRCEYSRITATPATSETCGVEPLPPPFCLSPSKAFLLRSASGIFRAHNRPG